MIDIITTLHPENDENTNLYPNVKGSNIPDKAINRAKLDDNINSLLNNIGSLVPSGVDTSAHILAFTENKGIYIATDNGHWYYWNETQYADGGVYQATEIADNSIYMNKLNDNIITYLENICGITYTKYIGKYLHYNGNLVDYVDAISFITDKIPVSQGDRFYYKGNYKGTAAPSYNLYLDDSVTSYKYINTYGSFTEIVIPENVNYIRFQTCVFSPNYPNLLVFKYDNIFNDIIKYINNLSNSSVIKEYTIGYFRNVDTIQPEPNFHSYLTNYISCKPNQKFLYKGYSTGLGASVIFYNSNFEMLSTSQYNSTTTYTLITIPNNCYYVRFSSLANINNDIIFDVIEEGTLSFDVYYLKQKHNILYDKNIMAIGDSMVYGDNIGVNNVWLKKICDRVNGNAINKGYNGTYIVNNTNTSIYARICDDTSPYYIDDNADYIIVFGGTNDVNTHAPLGDISSTNVMTFYGALKAICENLQTRYPLAHIGFITPYNINEYAQDYITAIKDVCKLYGIKVFDNVTEGGVDYNNTTQHNALFKDRVHLNTDGMEWVSYKYQSFIESL